MLERERERERKKERDCCEHLRVNIMNPNYPLVFRRGGELWAGAAADISRLVIRPCTGCSSRSQTLVGLILISDIPQSCPLASSANFPSALTEAGGQQNQCQPNKCLRPAGTLCIHTNTNIHVVYSFGTAISYSYQIFGSSTPISWTLYSISTPGEE